MLRLLLWAAGMLAAARATFAAQRKTRCGLISDDAGNRVYPVPYAR